MTPFLIAGPTASGKSSLALALAQRYNGIIINTDALQVYDKWRILSARPSIADALLAPHALYGHISMETHYSVGAWLSDVKRLLQATDLTPIFVGGTGLYFSALLNGLAEIPPIAPHIRAQGNKAREADGIAWFAQILEKSDPETFAQIDRQNPARLQRAWEVLETTGKGLAYWKSTTPPPLIAHEDTISIMLNWQVNSLNERIDYRFDQMMKLGAIAEVREVKNGHYHPALPSSRALGAAEIIDALDGKVSMQDAVLKGKLLTRQFAKRQRTWFRSKMKAWQQVDMTDSTSPSEIIANLDT